MQSITFVLAVALLHAVAATSEPNVELFRREYVEECAKELQITELIVEQNVDDLAENLKCFGRCLGSKSGILLDNGDIDERAFVVALYKQKRIPLREILERLANCKVLLKDTSCEAFSNFMVCFFKD